MLDEFQYDCLHYFISLKRLYIELKKGKKHDNKNICNVDKSIFGLLRYNTVTKYVRILKFLLNFLVLCNYSRNGKDHQKYRRILRINDKTQ